MLLPLLRLCYNNRLWLGVSREKKKWASSSWDEVGDSDALKASSSPFIPPLHLSLSLFLAVYMCVREGERETNTPNCCFNTKYIRCELAFYWDYTRHDGLEKNSIESSITINRPPFALAILVKPADLVMAGINIYGLERESEREIWRGI